MLLCDMKHSVWFTRWPGEISHIQRSDGTNRWLVGTKWFWDRLTQQNTETYVMRSETARCVGCMEQMRNTYNFSWEHQWKKAVCRLRHTWNRNPNTDHETTVKTEHRTDWFIQGILTDVEELLDQIFKIWFPMKMSDGLVKMYVPLTQLHSEKWQQLVSRHPIKVLSSDLPRSKRG